ncbi:MAG TPA: sterol-binding protein [Gammaproteobacteria bacterium]
MTGPLLARAESWLNRHIGESASASSVLAELEGRSVRLRVEGLGIDVLIAAEPGRLRLTRAGGGTTASATVRGTPLDLLRLLGPGMAGRIHGSGVEVSGRVAVAERFAALLRLAWPDPEEELAGWVGDVVAYRVGRAVRGAGGWAAKAAEALRLDTSEYLTEESRVLPTRYEADRLFAEVERLRDDVERAAERIERLAEHACPRERAAAE